MKKEKATKVMKVEVEGFSEKERQLRLTDGPEYTLNGRRNRTGNTRVSDVPRKEWPLCEKLRK